MNQKLIYGFNANEFKFLFQSYLKGTRSKNNGKYPWKDREKYISN